MCFLPLYNKVSRVSVVNIDKLTSKALKSGSRIINVSVSYLISQLFFSPQGDASLASNKRVQRSLALVGQSRLLVQN